MQAMLTSIEICAGAGGQALGLEHAGFSHHLLIDNDVDACNTLKANRPLWNVKQGSVSDLTLSDFRNSVDLFAGGVPCPPFSMAGKQLGQDDERDLFPHALRLIAECRPRAIMLENVKGLLSSKFSAYRKHILDSLSEMGYYGEFKLIQCSDFGVPQLRPRTILIATLRNIWEYFLWPDPLIHPQTHASTAILDLLEADGWSVPTDLAKKLDRIAPTIVGGSKKHGGPDLGPTRAKQEWHSMGINALGVANDPPQGSFTGLPKLTCKMVARLQGFPDDWLFSGGKTAQYRQIGNAFPPPAAAAIARQLFSALSDSKVRAFRKSRQSVPLLSREKTA